MKYFLYVLPVLILAWIGCDEVEDPYADSRVEVSTEFGDPAFNDTLYSDTTVTFKKIVLEDFTGHTCPNCPEGSRQAKDIQKQHPNEMIIVAIHNSDNFSKPVIDEDPEKHFPADFETTTGENLRIKYNMNSFPSGMIDRLQIGSNGAYLVSWVNWRQELEALFTDQDYMTPQIKLDIKLIYNTDNRLLRVFPKIEALESLIGDYYLSNYVLENGIVSPQIDSRANPPRVDDYVHDHTLRAGFENNEVGTLIFQSPSQGELYENDSLATADITIDTEWNADSLEVVSLIYEAQSGQIIQAQKVVFNP